MTSRLELRIAVRVRNLVWSHARSQQSATQGTQLSVSTEFALEAQWLDSWQSTTIPRAKAVHVSAISARGICHINDVSLIYGEKGMSIIKECTVALHCHEEFAFSIRSSSQ